MLNDAVLAVSIPFSVIASASNVLPSLTDFFKSFSVFCVALTNSENTLLKVVAVYEDAV